MCQTRQTESGTDYKIGGYWVDERDVCHGCLEERLAAGAEPREAEIRSVGGIYAGRYCDGCFKARYRQDWTYDYLDAGEYLEPEDY